MIGRNRIVMTSGQHTTLVELCQHWVETGEWQALYDALCEAGYPKMAQLHLVSSACSADSFKRNYCDIGFFLYRDYIDSLRLLQEMEAGQYDIG